MAGQKCKNTLSVTLGKRKSLAYITVVVRNTTKAYLRVMIYSTRLTSEYLKEVVRYYVATCILISSERGCFVYMD